MRKLKVLIIITVFFAFSGASPWEGAASMAPEGELPGVGFYVATNSFPKNTVVDITNLETNRSVRAIVANSLDSRGLLAIVSREAAELIGMRTGSINRIRMVQPSDPIAYTRFLEGLASGIPGFYYASEINEEVYVQESNNEEPFVMPVNSSRNEITALGSGITGPSYILEPEWNQREIINEGGQSVSETAYNEEAGRQAVEEAVRAAAEQLARERAEQEAALIAAEEAARDEALMAAEEQLARERAERLAALKAVEEAEITEAARLAAQEAARAEAERLAAETSARETSEREAELIAEEERYIRERAEQEAALISADEAARNEAFMAAEEQLARERAERLAALKAVEEAEITEAARLAAEEAARNEAAREAEKIEAERLAAQEAARARAEAERLAAEASARERLEYTLVPSEERPPENTIYGINPADIIPEIALPAPNEQPRQPAAAISEQPRPPAPASKLTNFSVQNITELAYGSYYVQIAAFESSSSVENVLRQIDRSFKPVVFQTGNMYRILLGPLNQGESAAVLQRFKSIGYTDAFVRHAR
ncbi:MAG: SPOR domain-containing protein [Treponema sp.]|jgi:hypothetical protein|nr:SPOR domain-containing protein [Treponema sp.]